MFCDPIACVAKDDDKNLRLRRHKHQHTFLHYLETGKGTLTESLAVSALPETDNPEGLRTHPKLCYCTGKVNN